MTITNKAATVMFTGRDCKAFNQLSPGAQCLMDSKASIGALKLKEQAVKNNESLARIGLATRETLRKIAGSQSILFSPQVEQIIESIIAGRTST
jgi:hypothetical protein